MSDQRIHFDKPVVVFLAFFILGSSIQCVDSIELQFANTDRQIVINGRITDLPGPYTVTITESGSFEVDVQEEKPISGAEVLVWSGQGQTYFFAEEAPGIYRSDSTRLLGRVGENYTLVATLPDGRSYRSTSEKMMPVFPILDVGYNFYEQTFLNETENISVQKMIDVLVTTRVASTPENAFVGWQVKGEFEFREIEALTDIFAFTGVGPEMFTCYIDDDIRLGDIRIHDGTSSLGSLLKNVPVKTIEVDWKFAFTYCAHITQYSLTENAYHYWSAVSELLDRGGTLLDNRPGQLQGNLSNENNANERVSGYFYVTAMRQTRLFVPRDSVGRPVPSCLLPDPEFEIPCKECVEIENSTRKRPDYWPQ